MPVTKRQPAKRVRRSITLAPEVDRQVHAIAKHRGVSDSHVLSELVEQAIESARQKEREFFDLAERFRSASDPVEVKRLGEQLGRSVFGE
jgi:predicted DNA-binding protein